MKATCVLYSMSDCTCDAIVLHHEIVSLTIQKLYPVVPGEGRPHVLVRGQVF